MSEITVKSWIEEISKNFVLGMIVRIFRTWTRAVVSLKLSQVTEYPKKERKSKVAKNRSREWLLLLSLWYDRQNIWNMYESGCSFKVISSKGMTKNGNKTKSGKKTKQRATFAFFVSADVWKVGKSIAIWKSKNPRCIRKVNALQNVTKSLIFQTQNHGYK